MMRFFKFLSIAIYICILPLTYCFSQGITNNELSSLFKENNTLIMYIGDVKSFHANQLERVAITIPHVADITSAENNEIIIAAKNNGYTKLTWQDLDGEHIIRIHVLFEDISLFKSSIDELLKSIDGLDISTKIAKNESKIILTGEVKTEADRERLDTLLEIYAEKIINLVTITEEFRSIKIEIDILEISKGDSKNLGIDWPGATTVTDAGRWSTLAGIPDAFFRITDWTRSTFISQVNFLIQEGNARILSRPRLVCQSGKEAELLVGGEMPILTSQAIRDSGSAIEVTTEVEYKEYGIKLTINPVVIPNSRIKIALNVDVSDVEDAVIIGDVNAPTAKAYPFTRRTTSTELVLNNSQTLVIGGLIKEKKEESIKKFPFLSSIPILGVLFRSYHTITGGGDNSDTELVIALTPIIIDPDDGKDNIQGSTAKNETAEKKVQKNSVSKVILNKYIQQVAEKIKNTFIYPAVAKEQKQEGSVQLAIQLSSSGQVLDAKITQPSGYACLDTNALKVARQASPYPSFPSEIESEDLWLNVPIVYNLK